MAKKLKPSLQVSEISSIVTPIFHVNISTVICAGTQPNVEIAESAGLPISKEDGGIIVEPTLEVAPDIYAAGDIISW